MKRSKTCRIKLGGKPLQQGKGIKNTKCNTVVTSWGGGLDSERVRERAPKVPAICYFFK